MVFAPQAFRNVNGMKIADHKCYVKLVPKGSTVKRKNFRLEILARWVL